MYSIEMVRMRLLPVCVLLMVVRDGRALGPLYMDSPTACGKTFSVGESPVQVKPRGTVGISNPPMLCLVNLESSYQSMNYKFEIVLEAAQFRDCSMKLELFDGVGGGGRFIQTFGCGTSATTGQYYSKGRSIALKLTRTRDQYFFGNDFTIRLQVYKATDGPDEFIGIGIPAGAIVGIVLGVLLLIAVAVLLGWCYKTGRIGGWANEDPSKPTISIVHNGQPGQTRTGTDNGNFVSWHNQDKLSNMSESRSNFDLDDARVWDSLTGLSNKDNNENINTGGTDKFPGRPNQGRYAKISVRGQKNEINTFKRDEPNNMSNSPGSRIRGRSQQQQGRGYGDSGVDSGELGLRGRRAGNSNRNDMKDTDDKKRTASGLFENPDKEGYLYDYEQVKKLSGTEIPKKVEEENFENELKNAIKRNSLKRLKNGGQSDATPGSSSATEQTDVSDTGNKKATDGNLTGPDAQSSPKHSKKKRKKSPKSPRKNKDDKDANDELGPDSAESRARHISGGDSPLPETFAPIFSDDEQEMRDFPTSQYQPSNQYQPGYQTGYPQPQYDPRYPMGSYPAGMPQGAYPGMPYQQAGQAPWYGDDGLQGPYGDGVHPGAPGYTSTPYYNNQYGVPQTDMTMAPGAPGATSALVPAGTILDDPQVPPPGTSLVRYDDDPLTGIKTSQVVWTDAKRDPTDPPPGTDNPQITRKTITRITARTTKDQLPDAANPSIQDMSFRTAQQIQASGQEPAFMSPTRGAPVHYPTAIQYGMDTPDRGNSAFYTNASTSRQIAGSPAPVIHEAPNRNQAFRDRITLAPETD